MAIHMDCRQGEGTTTSHSRQHINPLRSLLFQRKLYLHGDSTFSLLPMHIVTCPLNCLVEELHETAGLVFQCNDETH